MRRSISPGEPRRLLKRLGVGLSILFIVVYSLYQTRNLRRGPEIIIQSPLNGAVFAESPVTIRGIAKRISDISLNDRKIFVDREGQFKDDVMLLAGYNAVKIEAEDKFGRKTQKILELTYKLF
ncbi:MAG: hypothetical protein HYT43_01040 [Candidatus Taylorbacteria bacterium]|nr:hypothetical protein [Candidatus Taylorbacteria bacterium]